MANAVGAGIHHHLVRHPFQRFRRLQNGNREREPFEVLREISHSIRLHEASDLDRILRWEVHFRGLGQLDHCCRTQRTIEVHVQLRLGQADQQLRREHRRLENRRGDW